MQIFYLLMTKGNQCDMKKVMPKKGVIPKSEVIAIMESCLNKNEWNHNSKMIQIAFGRKFPPYWREEILLSGLYTRISKRWGK